MTPEYAEVQNLDGSQRNSGKSAGTSFLSNTSRQKPRSSSSRSIRDHNSKCMVFPIIAVILAIIIVTTGLSVFFYIKLFGKQNATAGDNASLPSSKEHFTSRSSANQPNAQFDTSSTSLSTTANSMLENMVPVYRYHEFDAYFYTTDKDEIGTITPGSTGKHGYKAEGIGFYLLKTQLPSTIPWYRYGAGAYKHFYTANWQEIGTNIPGVVSNGMALEGIIGYVYPTQQSGTCPLYRYVHINSLQHFYTIRPCEIRTITLGTVGQYFFKYEGIAAFVPTSLPCVYDVLAC